ncbi:MULTISPECIES: preprotein translocase subunit SecE [unclassified Corynebacterium]|uniref:preprotein translocase subunit SecE n=1 Tax=unclassified Corynebacterium TaxID=2624378 RepID=UPI002648D2A3|nr:preprotein translocase subunit SecE [Corynebacterium sp.]MDN5719941.1 preprotein translocase subunit SecE [Corynebacterium sp.]MDN6259316.1 preprotein translocase subunit SecE [Corynebacterium sp.]MDN6324489.1 preprotein translocase subunit SecE [Corynebacterium sp.]
MSDEKNDEVGSAGGPLRPSGKRQVSGYGAAHDHDNGVSAKIADVEGSKSGGSRILAFPRSVGSEVKKVIWPTGREMVTYSIVTIVFLIVITAICTVVDLLTGEGLEFMFGL